VRRALLVACLLLAACGTDEPSRDASGAVEEAGDVRVDRVRVGDCFDDQDDESVETLPVVPCAEAHDNEIYEVFDLTGESWPGLEEVQQRAAEGCLGPFADYVGVSLAESSLDAFPITPSEASWTDHDDRQVLCVITDPAGPSEGSVAGSDR
jgi:hypothetical protein